MSVISLLSPRTRTQRDTSVVKAVSIDAMTTVAPETTTTEAEDHTRRDSMMITTSRERVDQRVDTTESNALKDQIEAEIEAVHDLLEDLILLSALPVAVITKDLSAAVLEVIMLAQEILLHAEALTTECIRDVSMMAAREDRDMKAAREDKVMKAAREDKDMKAAREEEDIITNTGVAKIIKEAT
jgi:hypothetical protein